ncbi:uncharacterized protein LOC112454376 [Temnothorax curvispinosus]|uniref:Uncharacterized protein LOC112454376 n=1 Tax=Temnothorax curvispinosus TaxID=300111 RepID=A0A6J1PQC2_9HYME|nr:uncharacterized protein LOC112454376 [Temnothorax curvispinosus]
MAEPETQTEDETVTSEISGEAKTETDTDVTEVATIESGDEISTKYSDYESEMKLRKERFWIDKGYAELRLKPEQEIALDVARLPDAEAVETTLPLREYLPLGGFQLEHQTRTTVGPDRRRRTRIWRSMRGKQPTRIFRRKPKEGWKRRRDVFPRDPPDEEFLLREQKSDFANRKELGHARAPISRPESKQKLMVDRSAGKRLGLVDGEYVILELPFDRVYANVVLHGQKGMHAREMYPSRERRNTWKFCFYQAIVALLAKTQLRYKYVSSDNIDYIYDHAWMLYTHIGTINVKARQRLDDVVVYNYKYSVEIELIDKMEDVVARDFDIFHKENGLGKRIPLTRKDLLRVKVELGCEKVTDSGYVSAHESMKHFEEWLLKLIAQYRDCILRTTRFSLAFWQDGLFWYVYNPYRCDEYGMWDEWGCGACIVKFCSTDSLRRHLMILMLRCHAEVAYERDKDFSDIGEDELYVRFDVQLFHVTFHCCQLDNLKLLQRRVSKQPRRVDDDPSYSLEIEDLEDETDREEEDEEGDQREPRERATWLRRCRVTTWGKYAPADRERPDSAEITAADKARWHQYYVEEPNRLFSLWGDVHPTDDMFDEANRGMQAYACYVVCAGMTMITAPEYWSPNTLDAIVMCGDRYYTRSKHEAELKSVDDRYGAASRSFKYLSDRFEIGEILFEARMLPAVRGRLYDESSECLWRTLERVFSSYNFAVLTCESACLGLFKFCGAYYMCDVNSFGPPLFRYGHGAAYLLRATSFRKFVTVLVLTVGSPDRSRFSLNPIEILRIVEMDSESRAKTRERRHRFPKMPGKLPRFASDGQKKRRMKK